jgi:hypothetical protein
LKSVAVLVLEQMPYETNGIGTNGIGTNGIGTNDNRANILEHFH